MKKQEIDLIKTNIYFLNLKELRWILKSFSLSVSGKKQDLIHRILEHLRLPSDEANGVYPIAGLRKLKTSDDADNHIVEGIYKNNRHYRSLFTKKVGPHFKFTSFGMDWIKQCWKLGINPSFDDFVLYWEKEYERRKNGGAFKSKLTNRRVVFFRDNRGTPKEQLEAQWHSVREKAVEQVLRALKKYHQI